MSNIPDSLEGKIELIGRENLETTKKLVSKHLNFQGITIKQHKEHLFELINKFVFPKTKIYLDTNFWVRFRDIELKRNTTHDIQRLYEAIKYNVNQGNYICPISAEALAELTRQTDPVTKQAMCKVMDDFSGGTCIRNHQERTDLEIKEAIGKFINHPEIQFGQIIRPAKEAVWTKVPFIFGLFTPDIPTLPEPLGTASAKAMLDFLYSMRIEEMMRVMHKLHGDFVFGDMDFDAFAEKLNSDKHKHENENKSFRQMLKTELRGTLEGILPRIKKNIGDLFIGTSYLGRTINELDIDPLAIPIANGLYSCFIKSKFKNIVPSIIIPSHLHAAIRWDKTRKYYPNDFNDVLHTSAAIAYYDIYFTESSFKFLAESCKLDRLYPVRIYSDPKECIKAFYTDNYK